MGWGKRALVNGLVWLMFILLSVVPVTLYLGVAAFLGRMGWVNVPVFGVVSVVYAAAVVIVGFGLHPRLHGISHDLVQNL